MDHVSSSARPIVVAGDWHGDLQWARQVIRAAHAAGAKTILHVGDLGVLWPGRGKGRLDAKLDRYLDAFNMDLFFADGNHDNHVELRALGGGSRRACGGVAADKVFAARRPDRRPGHSDRSPRRGILGGSSLEDSRRGLVARRRGGGTSGREKLIAGGPVDILLAHDVPAAVELQSKWDDLEADTIAQAQVSRDLLQNAVDALRPPNVFSGHWHIRRTEFIHHVSGEETRVDVMDMDGSREGNAVLVRPGERLLIEPLIVGGAGS